MNNIEILIAYLDLAESQNYISSKNFLFFCEEYSKIRKDIEQEQTQIRAQVQEKNALTNKPVKIKTF